MVKTREEIKEDLKTIEKEIRQRDGIVFDEDWLHFFEKWRKEKNKYQDLNIEEVEFEIKRIHSDNQDNLVCKKRMGFTPKTSLDGNINWFSVKDLNNVKGLFINQPNTIKKTTMDLIKKTVDKKNTGKSEKLIPIKKGDVLISFKLSVGIVKIYNSDEVAYCNEAIDILTPKENIYNKYLAYNCMIEYPKYGIPTNNGLTLNDDDKKKIKIFIPKPYKTYSSYDIQKILVEFLEDNKNTSNKYREKLDSVDKDIKKIEDNLIPAIFAKNDDYIKKMWIKWNTDPVEPRKKEDKEDKKDMVDFTLEDIEFEEKELQDISKIIKAGGTPKRKIKNYWTTMDDENGIPWLDIDKKKFETFSINNYREKITEEGLKNSSAWIVPKNSIMITIGGSLGYIAYNKFETSTNQNILNVVLEDDYFYKYVVYVLNDFYKNNVRNRSDNKYGNLSKGSESERIIQIPKPIKTKTKEYSSYEVQKAIVSFIDRFYQWKSNIKKIMEKMRGLLDEMDEGFLYKTFKGRE